MTKAYQMRPRSEIDRADWDRLVEGSDETWMWHLSDLIDLFSTALHDISFGVHDERGALCAIVPLYLTSQQRARVFTHRYMELIGGPACAAGLTRSRHKTILLAIREYLMGLLERHGAERVGLFTPALAPCFRGRNGIRVNPLIEAGFADTQAATWIVDLNPPPNAIRAAYLDGTRYELKRAARDPYTLREASGSRDLETYYDLHAQTNRRTGRAPNPFDFLKMVFERCIPAGRARVVFFERKGRVMAAQTTATYKLGAYYWFGPSATDRDGGENRVLCDHQIMHARQCGCVAYDTGAATFWGGDAKMQGISNYKRSFGGMLVPQYCGRLISPRWRFRVMRAVRELMRDGQ